MTIEGYVIIMNCVTRRNDVSSKDGENTIDSVTIKDGLSRR